MTNQKLQGLTNLFLGVLKKEPDLGAARVEPRSALKIDENSHALRAVAALIEGGADVNKRRGLREPASEMVFGI